jgi:hypothetical protein
LIFGVYDSFHHCLSVIDQLQSPLALVVHLEDFHTFYKTTRYRVDYYLREI